MYIYIYICIYIYTYIHIYIYILYYIILYYIILYYIHTQIDELCINCTYIHIYTTPFTLLGLESRRRGPFGMHLIELLSADQ